jgi:hypothetical protein
MGKFVMKGNSGSFPLPLFPSILPPSSPFHFPSILLRYIHVLDRIKDIIGPCANNVYSADVLPP